MDTVPLARRQLGPLFGQIIDKGHLKVVSAIIMALELPSNAAANTSNMKLLVYQLVGHLIHQILYGGIKVSRVPVSGSLEEQLGLG